jgi:outer membrane protein OmpA-like peptidoglycan-associated protein
MDQQAKEIINNVPSASVARVGEGMDVTFASATLFDANSTVLNQHARENLTTLAQSLQKYPNTNLLIVGHTDVSDTEANSMGLSERRAAAVKNYLATQGVSPARMRSEGRGSTEPVAASDNEIDRQQNRRVEVAIFASDDFKAQAKNQ